METIIALGEVTVLFGAFVFAGACAIVHHALSDEKNVE